MVKKKIRGTFGAANRPLYTLIFAFYCSFKKQFFEKKRKVFLNLLYHNLFHCISKQQSSEEIAKIF